jgi:hypothetical protein
MSRRGGDVIRAVLWVLLGLALLALALVATAPELLADLGSAGGVAALAFGAALPGALLLLVLVVARKGRHDQPGAGRPSSPEARSSLTVDDLHRRTPDPEAPSNDPTSGA